MRFPKKILKKIFVLPLDGTAFFLLVSSLLVAGGGYLLLLRIVLPALTLPA